MVVVLWDTLCDILTPKHYEMLEHYGTHTGTLKRQKSHIVAKNGHLNYTVCEKVQFKKGSRCTCEINKTVDT